MGYYSDVAIALKPKAAESLKKAVSNAQDGKVQEHFQYLLNGSSVSKYSDDGSWLIVLKDVKWYWLDGYFSIEKFVMDFLSALPFDEYLYIRVGEDEDDVERWGNWYENPFDVYVSRRIEYS